MSPIVWSFKGTTHTVQGTPQNATALGTAEHPRATRTGPQAGAVSPRTGPGVPREHKVVRRPDALRGHPVGKRFDMVHRPRLSQLGVYTNRAVQSPARSHTVSARCA